MKTIIFLLALVGPGFSRIFRTMPNEEVLKKFRVNTESYIIGGQDTDEDEWPWQGYMESFGTFVCGLTVISEEWVLTAAHCIYYETPSTVTVGLGCTDLNSACQEFDVDQVIEHPDFAWDTSEGDDVGVMHLTTTLEFSESIQPITLSQETNVDVWADATGCYITGWVNTQVGGTPQYPNVLQEANVGVYTIQECEDLHGAGAIENNEHVCVGVQGESGSCNGDSGGPAVCPDGNGGYVQIGITSWGPIGCSPDLPSVYTNVAYFYDWISENCGGCV